MKPAALFLTGVVALVAIGAVTALAGNDTPAPQSPVAADVSLDPAARRYVDAVAGGDLDALVTAFAPDAVIVDVGREIRGHEAIRRWAETEVIGGALTVLGNTPRAGGTTMLVHFAPGGIGGFRANYSFDIADGLITRAELTYA